MVIVTRRRDDDRKAQGKAREGGMRTFVEKTPFQELKNGGSSLELQVDVITQGLGWLR